MRVKDSGPVLAGREAGEGAVVVRVEVPELDEADTDRNEAGSLLVVTQPKYSAGHFVARYLFSCLFLVVSIGYRSTFRNRNSHSHT